MRLLLPLSLLALTCACARVCGNVAPNASASASSPSLAFWHISDIHLDPLYQAGAPAGRPHYCRSGSGATPATYGRYMCDSPLPLLTSVSKLMYQEHPSPQFILVSGDMAAHALTQDQTMSAVAQALANLARAFTDVPIVPVIGNNDVVPHYAMKCGPNDQLDILASIFVEYTGRDAMETLRRGGYYAVTVKGLRIIVLNTVLFSTKIQPPREVEENPCEMMSWLEEELGNAEKAATPVLITGHIAPGSEGRVTVERDEWKPEYVHSYVQVIQRYVKSGLVIGQVFGHTHKDSYRLLHTVPEGDDDSAAAEIIAVAHLAPSVTPSTGNNPGVRLVKYSMQESGGGGQLDDFVNYTFDLFAAIYGTSESPSRATPDAVGVWQHHYTWTQAYPGYSLTAASLTQLSRAMLSDLGLFWTWSSHRSDMYTPDRAALYCSTVATDAAAMHACIQHISDSVGFLAH